jgi:hypothetical protein
MSGPHDLDRRLDDWLQDGPGRAPERPIAAALDHAQAHPRRRDPIAFARRDPMASGRFGAGFGALPLVAALGLLLVAAFAVASVGGLFLRPSVVPPPVTTPSPSAVPSPTPTGSAVPASAAPALHVPLTVTAGSPASVDIMDRSATLVGATSGVPGDGASVADGVVQVADDPSDPNTIVLTWSGTPCDTTHALTIAADGRTITIERPACSGDLLPLDRVLRLTFGGPVPAASVSATIRTLGG